MAIDTNDTECMPLLYTNAIAECCYILPSKLLSLVLCSEACAREGDLAQPALEPMHHPSKMQFWILLLPSRVFQLALFSLLQSRNWVFL